jgi:spermidine/putrescine transport system substrate-binding protein
MMKKGKQEKAPKQLLLVILMLAMTWLTACDNASPPPKTTVPSLAQELTFYDWKDDMPQSVLDAFTREYGIKVNYLSYESQEEATATIRAGQVYDVVVMETRFVPMLAREGLLAELNHTNLVNLKNIAANFRELAYDPGNRYCIPFNWGTTGLVVRSDLVAGPVTRWTDLWDPRYAGRVGIWMGQRREMIALTLKSLGYSANSENPAELEAALKRLNELRPHVLKLEDFDPVTSAGALNSGKVVLAMGYAYDVLQAREQNQSIGYVLPAEGALLWGDTFVIPANSPRQYTAEVFINFLLRPEINAQIANENHYATPNEAAFPFIDPAIHNDPVIYPPNQNLQNAEIILPLSPEGESLYQNIWERFLAAGK